MGRFPDVDAGFRWFESFLAIDRGSYDPRRHRLTRMRSLLGAFGNPQDRYRVIHVTGSKGKGSTAAFLGFCLAQAGMRCGIYSSPHVQDYRERVRIVHDRVREELAYDVLEEIARHVDSLRRTLPREELPTTFELLTLYGFLVFARSGCDVVVVEVGIGGRIDATNVVRPIASVITPIELEHTELLGSTHREIAAEKAGIIKNGRPVFVAPQVPEAAATLRRIAELRAAPFHQLELVNSGFRSTVTRGGTQLDYRLPDGGRIQTTLRMIGAVQATNAALAALTIRTLTPHIDTATIEAGLARAWLPGRSELIAGSPRVLLDGAHTARSVGLLTETARALTAPKATRIAVFGAVEGKDHRGMLEHLGRSCAELVITRPGTFKRSDVHGLHRLAIELGLPAHRADEPGEALTLARRLAAGDADALIVVTGSFYLVGELRASLIAAGREA
ncbi:MAG: bifunctional folylpolyglutamate synthase/dihydrofolate synthase [Spirochaetota bacterium]